MNDGAWYGTWQRMTQRHGEIKTLVSLISVMAAKKQHQLRFAGLLRMSRDMATIAWDVLLRIASILLCDARCWHMGVIVARSGLSGVRCRSPAVGILRMRSCAYRRISVI